MNLDDSVTGPDGQFEFTVPHHPARSAGLSYSVDGRATMLNRLDQLAPSTVVDLGDVPLPMGVQIEGRITDEEGRPVTGLSLQLINEGVGGTGAAFP